MRHLERQIATICRKAARRAAEGDESRIAITARTLGALPGARRPSSGSSRPRVGEIGVTNGLAWTESGGEVLMLEATMTRGTGLVLTGPARRRDEGIGARGAHLRALPQRRARLRRGDLRAPRGPPAHPGRRDSEGRPLGGDRDRDGDHLARDAHARAPRRGDDGRGDAARARAARRRRAREGARGAALRHHAR